MGTEEDTYSSIFQALKHPIRRRILRMLKEKPLSYTEILNELGVDNGLLNYHLENLQELLAKGEDEKYRLSEFGIAGLSVIDKVETPKNKVVTTRFLNSNNLQSIIVILLLVTSTLLNGYFYVDNQKLRQSQSSSNIDEVVSGVVIYRRGNNLWLRISSPDVNNEVGDIVEYNIEQDSDVDRGDFLQGKIIGNNTLILEAIFPFLEYDYNDGFMASGDLVLFNGGKIQFDLTDPFPTLRFSITNLGSLDVVGIRAWINDYEMPFTFGVSPESPVKPSRGESFDRYTAWYTPGGGTGGYLPMDDEEYTVRFLVKLSDRSTQTFTSSGVYQTGNYGSIRFMSGRNYLFFGDPDLVWLGRGEGGSLILSFRNTWYNEGSQPVKSFKIFLNDKMLTEESVNIRPSQYYAINIPIPYDITPQVNYEVKLVAYSETGLNSTYSNSVMCQYIRIN